MQPIAICAIFKNEAPYLLEWIAFHAMIGVDHFMLYDNGSDDGGADLVRASAFADRVTLSDWPERPGQLSAYADCIARHAARFAWIAFIDVDEFIHPLDANSLHDVLRHPRYSAFSAVLIFWLVFGSSGHLARPAGLVLENYRQRMPADSEVNCHVKTIARGSALQGVGTTPHIFPSSGEACDPAGTPVLRHALQPSPCHDILVLHHYFTKSEADWQAKLQRGKADEALVTDNPYPPDRIQIVNSQAQVEDTRIARFLPRLRWVLR